MEGLQLKPGGVLEYGRWVQGTEDTEGGLVVVDVSKEAIAYMTERVSFAEGVCLRDLFFILRDNPATHALFSRVRVKECLALFEQADPTAKADPDIEYLEFYETWEKDSAAQSMTSCNALSLHGLGPLRDYGESTSEKTRTPWGLGGAFLEPLLALPVKINPEVFVCEDGEQNNGEVLEKIRIPAPSLIQALYQMLWEISYFGTPTLR